jgi:hypothetical protein
MVFAYDFIPIGAQLFSLVQGQHCSRNIFASNEIIWHTIARDPAPGITLCQYDMLALLQFAVTPWHSSRIELKIQLTHVEGGSKDKIDTFK